MNRLLPLLLLTALPAAAAAQMADPAAVAQQKAAIARLGWMDGTWRGEAVTRGPAGEHRITQTERIGSLLDGTVKVMEGRGFNPDGSTGFNALGIVSYDPASRAYQFRSYAQGHAGTFPIVVTDTGYVWTIDMPGAAIRYTATLSKGTWTEVGERIVAGQAPARFFEMHLRRVGDSAWPAAGAMRP